MTTTAHAYPISDVAEHDTSGAPCWCDPCIETIDSKGTVVVHAKS